MKAKEFRRALVMALLEEKSSKPTTTEQEIPSSISMSSQVNRTSYSATSQSDILASSETSLTQEAIIAFADSPGILPEAQAIITHLALHHAIHGTSRRCAWCSRTGTRRVQTSIECAACQVALCRTECFELYHAWILSQDTTGTSSSLL